MRDDVFFLQDIAVGR